jgi:pimeloyl-ACP methyl ester carboxylesterase
MAGARDIVAALAASAQVATTACGDGALVWRRWGAGRPVVLCHGGSGSWLHWVRTIPALAGRAEVWAVDLPGLGDSAMPPPPLTPASCANVLTEGLVRLIGAAARPHLVGFSFGAHVATLAAVGLGERIASLTICGSSALGLPRSPHLRPFPKERTGMSASERADVHRGTLALLMLAEPGRIDDLALRIQAHNIARARFRSREFALSDDIRRALPEVRVPVHAIWGERDILAYPSLAAVRAVLSEHQPGLDWRTVADAGHWVMYEQADAFNRELTLALGI